MEEKLSVFKLLNRVSKLIFGNIKLAFFLILCSFPLFCFLIFFELTLQITVSIAYQFISQELDFTDFFRLQDEKVLSENDLIPWLVQTSLLYFFPYSLLDLLTTTMIVAASYIVYTSEEESSIVDLVRKSVKICQNRVGGCLITSLYVLLWSTSVFFGFFSNPINYLFMTSLSRSFESSPWEAAILFHAVVALVHGTIFIVLITKFSKWSTGWNMGLVISVLEEDEDGQGVYGSHALSLSAWYGRGHEKSDLWMMLMFLVLGLAMRLPCLYYKCSENLNGNGVLYTGLYVGLICVVNLVKWVASVISYHDFKTRVMRKKSDVEQAKPLAI